MDWQMIASLALGLIMGGATVWAWYAFHARGAPDKHKTDEEVIVHCSGYDVRFTLNTPATWRCEDCGDCAVTEKYRQRHARERCLSNKKRFVEAPLTFVAAPPVTVR
jgi:ABC-type ATPase with predicted acetyltransferase domain